MISIGSMVARNENRFVHHLKDHSGKGPFPPALPTPLCDCGLLAFVKQSRHPLSAGCAFYCCQLRRRASHLHCFLDECNFYQWIDGDEMVDQSIMLFPYDPWKSCPYDEFIRWVPPPPNPPQMTDAEKLDAALNCLVNRPKCHCDKIAELQVPRQRRLFTPFFRCGQRDDRGFPACDFEEYDYGPKSHWPSKYEVEEFAAGIKPWPCLKMADCKCKCGIKAHEVVVPSELGYGHYCGNAYGGPNELWVSLNR